MADAQRQVYWRGFIGYLLIVLSLIFLFLLLIKYVYVDFSYSPLNAAWGEKLRNFIDSLLKDWPVLDWLWSAIPTLHLPIHLFWYSFPILEVCWIGRRFIRSAYARNAQIADYRREREREAWRQQERSAQGLGPDNRVTPTVIGQAILYHYPAPPEPWSQKLLGILIAPLITGLIVGLTVLIVEYTYFQKGK